MKYKIDVFGMSIGEKIDKLKPPENNTPSQQNPVGFYVYGHYDSQNHLFYVGKGKGNRAWSDDRHPLWHRYVQNHLKGKYTIKIIADAMTEEQAERFEDSLITEHGKTLVNWINFGRETDFKVLEAFHKLRDANRKLISETRELETTNPEKAIENYKKAVEAIREYAFLDYDNNLVGQLLAEENNEIGRNGDLIALDRLTLVLCQQERGVDALKISNQYFETYKRDLLLKSAKTILKRVEKSTLKIKN